MAILSGLPSFSLSLLAAASAIASPPQPRASIASNQVVAFPKTVPSGTAGSVYSAFQPHLQIVNGCVPFPAVDAQGNTNAGLNPTGLTNGDCASSTGQIYVRGGSYNGYYALMYSWYMPKDEPANGLGHRHDWEGTIVWLKSSTSTAASNIAAVCPSAHGDWDCSTNGYTLSGTSPLISYYSTFPIDHQCGLTSTVGGTQPLVAWESLPAVAQTALSNTDFGSAIVPFIDAHFTNNLAAATF